MNTELFPCPVCGNRCLPEEKGSFEICDVCGWEEDGYQQDHIDSDLGPNGDWSLREARKAWKEGKTLFPRFPNPHGNNAPVK